VKPASVEGDWNRLYTEFPEVYDAFARVRHDPGPVDVIARRWPLSGARVVDVGSGTGTSTFELAERGATVVGVEPNPAMRALAEEAAQRAGAAAVSFLNGSAAALPVGNGTADLVTAVTTDFWPPEDAVPAFVVETERVLRPGGTAIVVNTPPGWYGGDLRDVVGDGSDDYDARLDAAFALAGFAAFDFDTVQDYGTPDHAIATYGFIFGAAAIARLRERGQARISWRWRVRHRTR
jgi:SAM-dependent methyltransferase